MAVREMECGLAGSLRARVQRGESATARCASMGNRQVSLFLFPVFLSRPIHHHRHSHQADHRADDIESIRLHVIDEPPPQNRQDDEPAAIGGIDPAEVRRLVGRHDAVQNQDDRAQEADAPVAAVPPPLPD